MDSALDFILGMMTVFCTAWIIIHIYMKWKIVKKDENVMNQIETIFSGGNKKIIDF